MKIAVLGTGMVGDAIGSRLIELGHNVMMGSRSAGNEKALQFVAKHPKGRASSGTFSDAASFGEILFNCIKGEYSAEALKRAGTGVKNKIIVDISNPLDFSKGMPPRLIPSLSNSHSLGEEIQKLFPDSKVIKTLNTMWCGLMVNPGMIAGGGHTNFICGNDNGAKDRVKSLLHEFGWKPGNIIDLGEISASRGMEAYLLLWLRIWGTTQNGAFNLNIVS